MLQKPVPQQESQLKNIAEHLSVINFGPPSHVEFCGEAIPMDNDKVKEKLTEEIRRNTDYYASMLLTFKRVNRYKEQFFTILEEQGIPRDFFYLSIAESHLSNAISPVGAKGFWQFVESTARQYGLEISETVDERFHPEKSAYAASRYLYDNYSQFKSWVLVAAAYNMGPGGLSRAIKTQGTASYFELNLNRETSRYLYRILALKYILEQPERYGFNIRNDQLYQPLSYRKVRVTENIPDLVTFAKSNGSSYREMKLMNPWLISNHLEVLPGKAYEIRFPVRPDFKAFELAVSGKSYDKKVVTQDSVKPANQVEKTVALVTDSNPVEVE